MKGPQAFYNDKIYVPGHVPDAGHVLSWAITRLGGAALGYRENQLVSECEAMRREGWHQFDMGTATNLRNRIQRNWIGSRIWRDLWGPKKGYAQIFTRHKICPGETRWSLVAGYVPPPIFIVGED